MMKDLFVLLQINYFNHLEPSKGGIIMNSRCKIL